MRVEANTEHQ